MKGIAIFLASALAAVLPALPAFSCTSVIISGKATGSGRPVMLKHRDTDNLNNRVEYFRGERYNFIGLVNSDRRTSPVASVPFSGAEVWTGTNAAGFSIMNTATYDLKDDDVPENLMEREGILMYRALSICRDLSDFEHFLDTLARPMGVESNFGVIDAHGGAAYYEVNNHAWFKFDVNEIPEGYRVVTNFTVNGKKERRKGEDRYAAAYLKMREVIEAGNNLDHITLLLGISRMGPPVLRDITASAVVYEGVLPGEDPFHTVMWTLLGYPMSSIYVPLLVLDENTLPSYVSGNNGRTQALLCDNALRIKKRDVLEACRETESFIDINFDRIYVDWTLGCYRVSRFKEVYRDLLEKAFEEYQKNFAQYLQ